jgi:oligopeptide transport system substrate-binding protein
LKSRWILRNINAGWLLFLVSLVILVSILAACTAKTPTTPPLTTSTSSGPQTSNPASPGQSTTFSPSSTAPPNTAASGQGTLKLADTGPITLDPALAAESSSGLYIAQIFSGLVRFDEKLNLVQDIAQSWDKSADGQTYTFHLRHDVKFQDGTAVKAADFKYSWERALNPTLQSLTAGTYLNDIVGANEVLSGKATALSGVKVIDDYTLQVNIDGPKAYFLSKMAFPTAYVVEKANVASGSQWWMHPVGTGPFQLKQWQADQLLVLQRNNNYYGDRARLNEVDFQLYGGNPIQSYQQGTIDVSDVPPVYVGLVTDPTNSVSKELSIFPQLSFSYLGFNTSTPPFDDINVRQAFCYAVDKQKTLQLSSNNILTPAYGILPPGMPGYNSALQGLTFDVNKAKQLIASSKYQDVSKLPPITFTTSGYGGNISGTLGGLISDWRTNLGVEVGVRQLEPSAFLYSLNQEKNQIFDGGWIADYPDPQDFLDVLFHSGSQYNTGGYSNSQVDSLLGQAATAQDPAARLKLYQSAEQIIVQDAAVLPLSFERSYVLVKPYVTGYYVSPLGFPLLNKVSIQH